MPNRFFRLLIVAVVLLLSVLLTGAGWGAQPGVVRLDILAVNDFHGALAATDRNPGAAVLAAYLKAERAGNPDGTLVLSAGDMFQGTPDSNLLHGKTVMAFMNAVGFDAMALGNHEFDWGLPVLKERIAQANFPVLAANIFDRTSGRRVDFVRPYVILEKQGIKIAVVGLITPETAVTTNPKNVDGFIFADPAATLENLLPELKRQGVAVAVALCHLESFAGDEPTGAAADLARLAAGDVAAVVSGHSHRQVAGKVAGVPVVQAYYSGRSVAAVHLAVSAASGEILGSTAAVNDVPANLAPDREVAAILAAAQREIAPVKGVVLGRAAAALPHDRYQFSPLGEWVTDAMRSAAGADIALFNGGGLRAGLTAGPVTLGDLYTVMPFDNDLCVAEMTGAQVLAALEYGIANGKFGTLQFAGLRVEFDAAAPAGKRVRTVALADGSPLLPDKVYRVAVNDFLAAGGDGYDMIKAAARHIDTYRQIREVLADAVRKAGVIQFQDDGRLRVRELSSRAARFIAA